MDKRPDRQFGVQIQTRMLHIIPQKIRTQTTMELVPACRRLLSDDESLQEMTIIGSSIGMDGAKLLEDALKQNSSLRTLVLDLGGLGLAGAKALSSGLKHNSTLVRLVLAHNCVVDSVVVELCTKGMTENSTLLELDLHSNYIGNAGVNAVCGLFRRNNNNHRICLQILNLNDNYIDDEGAVELAEVLKTR